MRQALMVLVAMFVLHEATNAAELQPKSVAFLIELGLDPKSPTITQIIADKVGERTLDTLAAIRDRDGVVRFVATRNFIRQYRANTRTPFPPTHLYNAQYLTPEEVKFVSAEIQRQECAATKTPPGQVPPGKLFPCPK
jgi:hypothetical protein